MKRINQFLTSKYGLSLDGKPRFRVVFSEDLKEHRKGLFSELAVFEEIREVPKYSFIKNRYILEVYTLAYPGIFGRAIRAKEEIVMSGDGYEPLRVFETKKKVYLRPDIEICEYICNQWSELVTRPAARRLNEKKATSEDVELMSKETARFFDILNQEDSDIIHQFRDKEALLLPGKELN